MKNLNKIRIEKIKEYKKEHNVPEFSTPDEYHKWLETKEGKAYIQALEKIRSDIKAHGGHREGAGRKRIYPERKTITKKLLPETVAVLKEFAKINEISENEALDRLINAGYSKLKKV